MANLGTSILALLAGGASGFAQGKARKRGEEQEEVARGQAAEERRTVRDQQAADRAEERRLRDQEIGIRSTQATESLKREENRDRATAGERDYQRGRDIVEDNFKKLQLEQKFDVDALQLQNQGLQNVINVLRATKGGTKENDAATSAQTFMQKSLLEAMSGIKDVPQEKVPAYLKTLQGIVEEQAYDIYGTTGSVSSDERLLKRLMRARTGTVAPGEEEEDAIDDAPAGIDLTGLGIPFVTPALRDYRKRNQVVRTVK